MKFATLIFALAALVAMASMQGCASTPTTQESAVIADVSEIGVTVGYDLIRAELIGDWNSNKISPATWTNVVAPALNTASADVAAYDANPTEAMLAANVQRDTAALAVIASNYVIQSSPTASSPPVPPPPPAAIPIPKASTQP
jgi:hypothetical protein